MRFVVRSVLMISVAGVLTGPSPVQPATPPSSALDQLVRWLTGEFDNFQQHFEARETKAPQPHERLHAVITPIVLPSLGSHVLLSRESALNDPDVVNALHVYSLAAGPGDDVVTLRLYEVTDPSVLASVRNTPSAPVELRPDQVRLMAGCDVTWRREGEAFVGTMRPGACRITWPRTGEQAIVTNSYCVTANEFAFTERLTDASGVVVAGRADGVPYRLLRARPFTCWAALRREGTTDKYDGMLDVAMHDQGKLVTFRDETGKLTPYSFELSQLRYGQKLPVMKLAVYESGKEQAIAYTWTEPTGTRIGINLRWFQVGCSAR